MSLYQHLQPNIKKHSPEFISRFGLNSTSFSLSNVRNRTEPPLDDHNFCTLLVHSSTYLGVYLNQYLRQNEIGVQQSRMSGV